MQNKKDYYIGLDIGTNSIGVACTDANYNILKVNNKPLYKVLTFDSIPTAEVKRAIRSNRRRKNRKENRIKYLNKVFKNEIEKVDPLFFTKIKESNLYAEDRTYADSELDVIGAYYVDSNGNRFKSNAHLRKELIESKEPHDVRLVYLALADLYKHRGHFNMSSYNENSNTEDTELSNMLKKLFFGCFAYVLTDEELDIWKECLLSKMSKSNKKRTFKEKTNISDETILAFINLTFGCSVNLKDLFPEREFFNEFKSISFESEVCDEILNLLGSNIPDDVYDLLLTLKELYNWGILKTLMRSNNDKEVPYQYYCEVLVDRYTKHKEDLDLLKAFYKNYSPKQKYNFMFRSDEKGSYSEYVGHVLSKGKKITPCFGMQGGNIFSTIRKDIEEYKKKNDVKENASVYETANKIMAEIDEGSFLPKIRSVTNSVIPVQLYKKEFIAILNNAKEYLSFLNEKGASGFTIAEELIQLLEFKLPYFIGPACTDSMYSWVVFKEGQKNRPLYPWTINNVIDIEATMESFIKSLIGKCTYLENEYVLPKASILYQRFALLNEINTISINGDRINNGLKEKLYEHLKNGKTMTTNQLQVFIAKELECNKGDIIVTGIDKNIKNTMSSYAKFLTFFNKETLSDVEEQIAEDIIYFTTVYKDEKKYVFKSLENKYPNFFSKEQKKEIKKMSFKDWGNLSEKFLLLKDKNNVNLINFMRSNSVNLQEALSSEYTFKDTLENIVVRKEFSLMDVTYEEIDKLQVTGNVKRMIWQTIRILKDIYKTVGYAPKRIFIEMAREKGEKIESVPRIKTLLEIFAKDAEWKTVINQFDDRDLHNRKLYLWLLQRGVCAYTGKYIPYEKAMSENYDIDHIYPKSLGGEDSVYTNRVFCYKNANQIKQNKYPIAKEIRNKMAPTWKKWNSMGCITDEVLKRLLRDTELSDNELAGFIARQLVETRQGTKLLADICKNTSENTEIIYVKAENVSKFRQAYNFVKMRGLNRYHHAQDAYLNIVVGNAYHVKYTKNPINFVKEMRKNNIKYNIHRLFDYDIERNGEVAWKANETIETVIEVINFAHPKVKKLARENYSALSKNTSIVSPKYISNPKGYLSHKKSGPLSDVLKYGGKKSPATAYFYCIEHEDKKGNKKRTIEVVLNMDREKLKSKAAKEQYCNEVLGYRNPKVIRNKILINTEFNINGFRGYITGRSGNNILFIPAEQYILDNKSMLYLKKIDSLWSREYRLEASEFEKLAKDKNIYEQSLIDNKKKKEAIFITRENNEKLYRALIDIYDNTAFSKYPMNSAKKIKEDFDNFKKADLKAQIKFLVDIFNTEFVDKRTFGGSVLKIKISNCLNNNVSF